MWKSESDQVVVVVTRAHLVAGGMAGRLEATHESCGGERPQHVVDRLVRHGAELSAHCTGEFVGGGVRVRFDEAEHGHARRGDTQSSATQQLGGGSVLHLCD